MIKISSPAFAQGGKIPAKYTCDGDNISPPLDISEIPVATKSLALTVDDPDAPVGVWNHWLVWDIDPKTTHIPENSASPGAVVGVNDFGANNYGGPCPPSGTHRYFFKIFALDTMLDLPPSSKRGDLDSALSGHIIDESELMGKYSRMV